MERQKVEGSLGVPGQSIGIGEEHTLMFLSQERDTSKYHIHYYLCGKILFLNKLDWIHVSQGSNVNELKASI